jgi:hypothetical protein
MRRVEVVPVAPLFGILQAVILFVLPTFIFYLLSYSHAIVSFLLHIRVDFMYFFN